MTDCYKSELDWLDLFNNSDYYETNNQTSNENICKGHFIICEFTTPCLVKIDSNDKYCTQHKTRYRFDKPKECLICFETLNKNVNIPLSCGHWVHKQCIKKSKKHQCPMCRQSIHIEDILYFMGKQYKTKIDILNSGIIGYDLRNIDTELIIDCLIIKFEEIRYIQVIQRLQNIKSKISTLDIDEIKFIRNVILSCIPREIRSVTYWGVLLISKLENNIFLNEISQNIPPVPEHEPGNDQQLISESPPEAVSENITQINSRQDGIMRRIFNYFF